jgi:guanine deaminase
MCSHDAFMRQALELATQNVRFGKGGPFGAVVVKDGVVIAKGVNQVTATNDPTAHAEMVAIRVACQVLGTFQLTGCTFYASCEPCPMCLGALYWARPDKVYFANTHIEAAAAGFDDSLIYSEFQLPLHARKLEMERLTPEGSLECFRAWEESESKTEY